MASVQVGDLCSGIVVAVSRSGALEVALDGVSGPASGVIRSRDRDWRWPAAEELKPGDRVTAGVMAIDADQGRVRLSGAAARHPGLWAFLSGLIPGEVLSGTIAAIKPFGVFVSLDDGPRHPTFPGEGFITYPELSWCHFGSAEEIVRVGQRVSCKFLQFDTTKRRGPAVAACAAARSRQGLPRRGRGRPGLARDRHQGCPVRRLRPGR